MFKMLKNYNIFPECCYTRKVFGMGPEHDGVYIFKRNFKGTIYAACNSDCIYSRVGSEFDGIEYCFEDKFPPLGTITDECEVHPTIGKGLKKLNFLIEVFTFYFRSLSFKLIINCFTLSSIYWTFDWRNWTLYKSKWWSCRNKKD